MKQLSSGSCAFAVFTLEVAVNWTWEKTKSGVPHFSETKGVYKKELPLFFTPQY